MSVLNITMVPNKNVNEETKSKLEKFKWKCMKFERNLIQIQILFESPNYVSYEGLDRITVQVLNKNFFQAKEKESGGRHLKRSSGAIYLPHRYTMAHTLPKQFHDKEIAKAMETVVAATKDTVQKSFIITIGTNALLAGSISLIWGFINTL